MISFYSFLKNAINGTQRKFSSIFEPDCLTLLCEYNLRKLIKGLSKGENLTFIAVRSYTYSTGRGGGAPPTYLTGTMTPL
jgi:hypothetical protein